jgi:hypothetical protein
MSSPGFVMKAIKTGFDAINVSIPTYSGLRVKGFTVDEAIDYLQRRALSAGISVIDGGLMDFEEFGPDEDEVRFEDKASQTDERRLAVLLSAKARTHGGRFPYSMETASLPFERVIAYGFRGDSRAPGAIKNAGGFNPNYTRPDQIAKAVAAKHPMNQALDLPKFLENQFLGGYVSVSKSYAVAKAFATGQGGTTESADGHPGWVYCCFVEGGFDIPPSGTIPAAAGRPAIYVPCDEQEIAMPGLLEWADIVACRKVNKSGRFEGNVYLRRSFLNDEVSLGKDVWRMLSGATQGDGL